MTELYPGADQDEKDGYIHDTVPAQRSVTSNGRSSFENWLQNVHGLSSEWDAKRNCYKDFAAHLAWRAWDQAVTDEIERLQGELAHVVGLAARNVTGCGTCHTIRLYLTSQDETAP